MVKLVDLQRLGGDREVEVELVIGIKKQINSVEVICCRCKCVAVLLLDRNNQVIKTAESMSIDVLIDHQTLTAENI